eukprot:GAHX01001456.1.p1 GENE.GAHX01001456.1~~GAHX01001456.1.p1  ORF type:complete len:203 (-),score=43.82 GAHX01001456.1:49-657(-)
MMRKITKEELENLRKKLKTYFGPVTDQKLDVENYDYMVIKTRLYRIRKNIMKKFCSLPSNCIMGMGELIGKLTKTKRTMFYITALDFLEDSPNKVELNYEKEKAFLYGNNLHKGNVNRISESIENNSGCVVYKAQKGGKKTKKGSVMDKEEVPTKDFGNFSIGFGASNVDSYKFKTMVDNTKLVMYRNGDIGEFLRSESEMF